MRNSRDLHKKLSYNELIGSLSPDLQAEVVLRMSAKTLDQARAGYFGPARIERQKGATEEAASTTIEAAIIHIPCIHLDPFLKPPAFGGGSPCPCACALRRFGISVS